MPPKPYKAAHLDPDLAKAVQQMPPIDNSDVARARHMVTMMQDYLPPLDERGVLIKELSIPGFKKAIKVRVYQPEDAARPAPLLLFFHWGGFMLGGLDTEHARCVMIAKEAACVVLSVDHSLAPEHPFPAAPEDCYAALNWAVNNADDLGIDPDQIAVGGTSSGGGLAAAVTLMARDRQGPNIMFQFMGFPVTDNHMSTPSVRAYTDTPNWTHDANVNMWRYYLGEDYTQIESAYAAPLRTNDLSKLPPAYIWTAEFDPLRDEGITYAKALIDAGVTVELHNYPGAFHGFDQVPGATIAERSQREQVAVLKAAFGTVASAETTNAARLAHIMIHVTDVAKTIHWYTELFGFKITFITPEKNYAELSTGSTTLAFSDEVLEVAKYGEFTHNRPEEVPAGFHLTLEVNDLPSVYAEVLAAGAISINAPEPQPWGGFVARVRDPNGILIALGGETP